jgi:hypothetical protein
MDTEEYFIGHYAVERSVITYIYELFTIEYLPFPRYCSKGWKNQFPAKKLNFKHTAGIKFPLLIDFSKRKVTLDQLNEMQRCIGLKQRCCKSEVDDGEYNKYKSNQDRSEFIGMYERYEKGILNEDDIQYISMAYAIWFNEEWIKVMKEYRKKHLFIELRAATEKVGDKLMKYATGEFKKIELKLDGEMEIMELKKISLHKSTDYLSYLSIPRDIIFNGDFIMETYGKPIQYLCYDWRLVTPKERVQFTEDFMGRSVTSKELVELDVAFQKL